MNLYKERLKKILEYIEENKDCDEELYLTVKTISSKNIITMDDFKEIVGKDNIISNLQTNGIKYIITPKEDFFEFQAIIELIDNIIVIPCYAINDEHDWELDLDKIEILEYEDLRSIKNKVEDLLKEVMQLLQDNEPALLVKALNNKESIID